MAIFRHLPHTSGRVRLRRLRVSDFRAFHTYRSDPEVARYQGWSPMTEVEAEAFLRDHARNAGLEAGEWTQLAIASAEDDRLLGDIGLFLAPDARWAEFGVSLDPGAQGSGLGTETAQALIALLLAHTPVRRVVAASDVRNAACLRMLEKAGMSLVDVAKTEYKGEVCTEHVFAIERGSPPQ